MRTITKVLLTIGCILTGILIYYVVVMITAIGCTIENKNPAHSIRVSQDVGVLIMSRIFFNRIAEANGA